MRISLQDRQGKRHSIRSKRATRHERGRPYRTLDASVHRVQFVPRARPEATRPAPKRRWTALHSEHVQTDAAPVLRPQIRWRVVFLRTVAVAALVATLGAIAYVSTTADYFVYERNTMIQGNRYVDRALIYQAAGIDELNIFWVRPKKVADSILKLDGIKSVNVRCSLPAKVVIKVEERKPVVRWHAQEQKTDWWLDEEGVVLPYTSVATSTVSVVDSSALQLKSGDRVTPDGIVPSVQHLSQSLPDVQVLYYHSDRGLSFTQKTSVGEWPVYIGDSKDLPKKIQVLQALTKYLVTNRIRPRYVDVRWADYPVYGKPAGQVTGGGN